MRFAVILAGGGGTRLWPASRVAKPKQFLPLGGNGEESLLAATARRLNGVCAPDNIVVVTAANQSAAVAHAVPHLPTRNIIAEPAARNTGAALGLAAVVLAHRDPDAVMGAMPSDHHISDEAAFCIAVEKAFTAAEADDVICTIGIVPNRPATGFGYMEVAAKGTPKRVLRFIEKPDRETARSYLMRGDFLWNAGMFFVKARVLLNEIKEHMPETYAVLATLESCLAAGDDAGFASKLTELYPTVPSISIDYGVMENAVDVMTVPAQFGWSDVGSWAALDDYGQKDAKKNVCRGEVALIDSRNNVVISDGDGIVGVIGVEGLVVVRSGDAVLVVPKERAQDVRQIVADLKHRKLDKYL